MFIAFNTAASDSNARGACQLAEVKFVTGEATSL